MSKHRKHSKKPKTTIRLEKGKFYFAHDRSKTNHPGRIESADYEKDAYLAITTRSLTEEEYKAIKNDRAFWKKYQELKYPTDKRVFKSFINRRPFLGSRADFGNRELEDMKFHKDDNSKILKAKSKKPRLGKWYMK